ncbi:hypothetical protein [Streptomyces sp. NRRL S-118]|uniref:hypothetical protein n=1 Tax=Streptomyces sp. NRRL S-118 TaxID=1463881 RepID=UPI0004CA7E09|nr:hypothetical protein [Streptomyces sp. NRRL S-118]
MADRTVLFHLSDLRNVGANASARLTVSYRGTPVARLRPGRVVWWLVLGWFASDPYTSLTGKGAAALVCVMSLGAALGFLGSLAALAGAGSMVAAGTPVPDLLWWVLPLLGGWLLGAASASAARMYLADVGAIVVLAVPVLALLTHLHSWWSAGVFAVLFVLLIVPHLRFLQEMAGVTRFNRTELRLGAVIWPLAAALLAMSPAGEWFVQYWPDGALGFLAGTAGTTAVMIAAKGAFLLAVRGSLATVHVTAGPARLRVNRDRFSGLYGAETGVAWFCVLAAGVFHADACAFLGSAIALTLSFVPVLVHRVEVALRYTVQRLDAALYVFSRGRRRRELQEAWIADARRVLSMFALDRQVDGGRPPAASQPALRLHKSRENGRSIAIRAAYELVEAMLDEGKKTAHGDVDDTMWLPFARKDGRPQLLNVALQWADEAKMLLDALPEDGLPALSTPGTPLHTAHHGYRCYCRNVRGIVHELHGRIEEAMADHYAAARICRSIGAVNTEAIMLSNCRRSLFGVQVRPRSGPSASRLQRIDADLLRIVTEEDLHPQIRRQLAVEVAYQCLTAGSRATAERMMRLAADLPLRREERTVLGIESVHVGDQMTTVHLGPVHYDFPLNLVDYSGFSRSADLDAFLTLPFAPAPGPLSYLSEQFFPDHRLLSRGMTMTPLTTGFPGVYVHFPNLRAIEAWIQRTERRAGAGLTAQLREQIGLALRTEDPYRAADHLVRAFAHRQSVHFGILDDALRAAVRGAAEEFGDLVIGHLAALAASEDVQPTQPPMTTAALNVAASAKSRALAELLGESVPPPPDGDDLLDREQRARQRYDEARSSRDPLRLREAREELEHCWSALMAADDPSAAYAALRAGLPVDHDELRVLLARTQSAGNPPYGTPSPPGT